jgi:hypothetical protein
MQKSESLYNLKWPNIKYSKPSTYIFFFKLYQRQILVWKKIKLQMHEKQMFNISNTLLFDVLNVNIWVHTFLSFAKNGMHNTSV